jgi:hypothetical protein
MASELDQLLSRYDPDVRRTARAARRLVRRLLPDAVEQIDHPGGRVGYALSARMADVVFVILLSKAGVKLGIADGATLADPAGLLTGAGKRHRHIPIASPEALEAPALLALLRRAVDRKRGA